MAPANIPIYRKYRDPLHPLRPHHSPQQNGSIPAGVLFTVSFLRHHFPALVLLANAGAFAVLLAELAILDHFDGFQLVAPVAALTGLVACLLAVVLPSRLPLLMVVPLALVALAGLVGVYRHLDERDADLPLLTAPAALAHDDGDDKDEDEDDDEHEPPPLAPLGLSGSAMLGVLAATAAAFPASRDA